VTAYQGEGAADPMFIFEGSFQRSEPFYLEYQRPMPSVPPPENLVSYKEIYASALRDLRLSPILRPLIEAKLADTAAMEERPPRRTPDLTAPASPKASPATCLPRLDKSLWSGSPCPTRRLSPSRRSVL
jgi:hypothetical protein